MNSLDATNHRDISLSVCPKAIQALMVTVPGTSKPMCKICGFTSKLKTTIKRHVIAKHTDIRYPCQLCPKRMSREGTRVIHYKQVHGVILSIPQIRKMMKEENISNSCPTN
ncbi:hypothetical protein TCAL_16335 [Tigriopus californicus]|uniref:C2H2-type domain-containing protein n=1 Tax=Tigriopus californicus TaxID=6832 RepID=A0A553N740_TIGCA|nr:hypothetical protein TCAL_16335 [Tigriopus californicus]